MAESFTWKHSGVCDAVYKVLSGDKFMNQVDADSTSFDDAGAFKIGNLVSFPASASNPDILKGFGLGFGNILLLHLEKSFGAKDKPDVTFKKKLSAVAGVFSKKDKTITDLAKAVDANMTFP